MRTLLKLFFVLVLAAILVSGGYLIYRYIFPRALPIAQSPNAQVSATTTRTTETKNAKLFSQQTIFDYWVNTKTNAAYLVAPDGKITRTFGDGREDAASTQPLANLHRIIPATDGTRSLAHFGYPANDVFAVFDTETKSWERLPTGTVMATFDPSGMRIAYVRRTNGVSTLYLLTLSDKKTVEVMKLTAADGVLVWDTAQEITILPVPGARFSADALAINLTNKSVRKEDVGVMFTRNVASIGLRLTPSNGAPQELRLVHNAKGFDQPLPFFTIPSKCAIRGADTLYCGVPLEFPERAALPDDYLKEKFFAQDSLLKYTIATGETEVVLDSLFGTFDAEHLSVRGKQLLFKNRYDEKLYAVELVQAKK